MPGFNQKGPMNEGSMTGRGLGRCAASPRNVGDTQDMAGVGSGYGRGQGRAMGRGRCQRIWPGEGMARDAQVSQQLQPAGDEALKLRVRQLENELEALRHQMKRVDNQ